MRGGKVLRGGQGVERYKQAGSQQCEAACTGMNRVFEGARAGLVLQHLAGEAKPMHPDQKLRPAGKQSFRRDGMFKVGDLIHATTHSVVRPEPRPGRQRWPECHPGRRSGRGPAAREVANGGLASGQ